MEMFVAVRSYFLLFLVVLCFCSGCGQREPVKIGFVGTLMGVSSNLSVAGRNGVMLAVEEINRQGGINGRELQLLVKDDKNEANVALQVDRELIAEGVVAIIGHMTSKASLAVMPEMNLRRMLLISPTVGADRLTGMDDFLIRLRPGALPEVALIAEALIHRFNLKTVSIVYDVGNADFSVDWFNQFRDAYTEAGGQLLATVTFSSGISFGFYDMADELCKVKPEAVVFIANCHDTAMIGQQVRKIRPLAPLFTTSWAGFGNLIDYGGSALNGLIFPGIAFRKPIIDNFETFNTAYHARFGVEPQWAAAGGYDAMKILYQAILASDVLTPEALRNKMIELQTFQGVQGEYFINRFGDLEAPYQLFSLENGEIRPL